MRYLCMHCKCGFSKKYPFQRPLFPLLLHLGLHSFNQCDKRIILYSLALMSVADCITLKKSGVRMQQYENQGPLCIQGDMMILLLKLQKYRRVQLAKVYYSYLCLVPVILTTFGFYAVMNFTCKKTVFEMDMFTLKISITKWTLTSQHCQSIANSIQHIYDKI